MVDKMMIKQNLERAMNEGDLSAIDEHFDPKGVDHQEPPGTAIIPHLREVVTGLRRAFPDLHFEVTNVMVDGDMVAYYAIMTGTQDGVFELIPGRALPPTGRKINVAHLYMERFTNGKSTDLWHQWDVQGLMRQLGVMPGQPQSSHA